jgi:hypothetical protein
MPNVMRDAQMAWVAFVVALLGIAASVLLLVTFTTEVPYNGPYRAGSGYVIVEIVANLLTAIVVVHLSRLAGPSFGARVLAPVLAVVLVLGAGSGLLLITQVIGYALFAAVSIMALFLLGLWMFWLNRRMRQGRILSNFVGTFGALTGAGMAIGLPVAAIGLILPPLRLAQLLVLGLGIFIAGGAVLVAPVWWVMVGVVLSRRGRGPRGEARSGADDSTDGGFGAVTTHAATSSSATAKKARGRRKA